MKSYVSRDAACPFYHREDACRVLCEGPAKGIALQLSFGGRRSYEQYRREYCYRNWDRCLVAQMLVQKYEAAR